MTLKPLPGFKSLTAHHCVTGPMRHIYVYNNHDVSEDMLLGIGRGVGFVYWHQKGTLPFIGGRANVERPGEEGLVKTAGRRTGVRVESFQTSSARKAEMFKSASEADDPAASLPEISSLFLELADLEETTWSRLRELVR
jgi:hypothetical protein